MLSGAQQLQILLQFVSCLSGLFIVCSIVLLFIFNVVKYKYHLTFEVIRRPPLLANRK